MRNESAGRTQLGRNTFNGQIKDKDVFMLKIALPRVATRTHLPSVYLLAYKRKTTCLSISREQSD